MPEEHELAYDGCKYKCYLKEVKGKKSSYFRVFCRNTDPKCKVGVQVSAPAATVIAPVWEIPPLLPEAPTKPKQQNIIEWYQSAIMEYDGFNLTRAEWLEKDLTALRGQDLYSNQTLTDALALVRGEALQAYLAPSIKTEQDKVYQIELRTESAKNAIGFSLTTHRNMIMDALKHGVEVPERVRQEYKPSGYPARGVISASNLPSVRKKQYYQMTIGEFIDNYELKAGDPTVTFAYVYAYGEQEKLPKGVDTMNIVRGTITGFFTNSYGEQMATLIGAEIVKQEGKYVVDTKIVESLRGKKGITPVAELGYGVIHKEFIKEALREGKDVPAKVLNEYPELTK